MQLMPKRIFLSALLLALALLTYPLKTQQAQTPRLGQIRSLASLAPEQGDGFITVRTATGTECRPMTAAETQQYQLNERTVELQALAQPNELLSQQQTGLKISLRSTAQLDNFPAARAAFLRAAAKWEAIIQTPITIIVDVDFGPTRFGIPYGSGTIGATGTQTLVATGGYAAFRSALVERSTTAAQTTLLNTLPILSLPTELGNFLNASGPSANIRALGLIDAQANPTAEQDRFGAPPSIGFNSNFAFDFDPSNGIDADKLDFEFVATHEMGHALGFSTFNGAKELNPITTSAPTVWDFLRFRPGNLDLATLGTRKRALLAGGDHIFFTGEEFALSTATSQATNGDGRQPSHWKSDELTGKYIGIMDPTGASGDRLEITQADLNALAHMGYTINPQTRGFELLSVADYRPEEAQDRATAWVVNRYTPTRFPARLEGLDLTVPPGGSPVGQTVRLIAFVDAARTGQPPANPTLIADQTVTLGDIPTSSRTLSLRFNTPPTINGGDVYVGIQTTNASVLIAADTTGTLSNRSFISTTNGQSFVPLTSTANAQVRVNFLARGLFSSTFGTAPAPQLLTLSPSAAPVGTVNLPLFVSGAGFQPNSVIRWKGSDRPTTYISASQLRATLPTSDMTSAGNAAVTVFTPNTTESVALNFTIGSDNPVPLITALDPPNGVLGAGATAINVYGRNFTNQSTVRINDANRPTTFVNSTQLTATLPASDFASPANLILSVVTPTPGGGPSNGTAFSVTGCNYSFALNNGATFTTLLVSSLSADGSGFLESGFIVNTPNGACSWNATSSESWLTLPGVTSGTGKSVVNFRLTENTSALPREARISLGGQTITMRQAGRQTSVSAASFASTSLAPDGITSAFGQGLASSIVVATTTPLPTVLGNTIVRVTDSLGSARDAQLFFVSPGQINYVIPSATASGLATIQVRVDGSLYADGRVAITPTLPALFAANANGQGVPAGSLLRVKPDGTQVFEALANLENNRFVPRALDLSPDADQFALVLFGTGFRRVSGLNLVNLKLGDIDVPALFAGAQGSLVGVDQLNLHLTPIRAQLRGRGELTLSGTINGQAINPLLLRFQ